MEAGLPPQGLPDPPHLVGRVGGGGGSSWEGCVPLNPPSLTVVLDLIAAHHTPLLMFVTLARPPRLCQEAQGSRPTG